MGKSWTEKFEAARPHQLKPVPVNIAGMKKGEITLVPSPHMVADFIATIPTGRIMDVKTLREPLARRHKAEVTCPITTGFHLRPVAEAVLEARGPGARLADITHSGACSMSTRRQRRNCPAERPSSQSCAGRRAWPSSAD